jgi:bacterioferritin
MEDGPVTDTNTADVTQIIDVLNDMVATEVVCYLRYSQHAGEELQHGLWAAERISQLGGEPDFNPTTLAQRVG